MVHAGVSRQFGWRLRAQPEQVFRRSDDRAVGGDKQRDRDDRVDAARVQAIDGSLQSASSGHAERDFNRIDRVDGACHVEHPAVPFRGAAVRQQQDAGVVGRGRSRNEQREEKDDAGNCSEHDRFRSAAPRLNGR